jgi:hypothetical protein
MHDMVSGKGTGERSMRAWISAAGRARRCVGCRAAVGAGSAAEGGPSCGGVEDCILEGSEDEDSAELLDGADFDFQNKSMAWI